MEKSKQTIQVISDGAVAITPLTFNILVEGNRVELKNEIDVLRLYLNKPRLRKQILNNIFVLVNRLVNTYKFTTKDVLELITGKRVSVDSHGLAVDEEQEFDRILEGIPAAVKTTTLGADSKSLALRLLLLVTIVR